MLSDMRGSTVKNWLVGEKTTLGTHIAYHCRCQVCGFERTITATDLNCERNLICRRCSGKKSFYAEDNLKDTKQGSFTIGEPFRKNNRTYYHVVCDCRKKYDILRDNLIRKKYRNCKCHGNAINPEQKYGMLRPIRRLDDGKWECLCDCGRTCVKTPSYLLRDGMNFSCGCKKKADRVALRTDNRTGVKGVCLDKNTGKYLAYITKDKKTYRIGYFDTIAEATAARKSKEEELFGTANGGKE